MSEILAFQAILFICCTVGFVASLGFIRRFLELRQERLLRAAPRDASSERLERVEMMVESTAVEVERLAEANRFMAKLLAERVGLPNAVANPGRVITPH
jgi:hypothetical protein